MEEVVALLSTGIGGHGRDALGDTNRENASLMQRLTPCRVSDTKGTRDRVDPELGRPLDTRDGALDLGEPGQHRTGIAWMALRGQVGEDTTRRRLCHEARCTAKLRWALALAFEDRGDGGILGCVCKLRFGLSIAYYA